MRLADRRTSCAAANTGNKTIVEELALAHFVDVICRATTAGDIVREHTVIAAAAPHGCTAVHVVVVSYRSTFRRRIPLEDAI